MTRVVMEARVATPLGTTHALLVDSVVFALGFAETWPTLRARALATAGNVGSAVGDAPELAHAMGEYFAGRLEALEGVRVWLWGSAFQNTVWSALREVPVGETWAYTQMANLLGLSRAARAIGTANARNPVAIIVPCHRLVGSSGDLRGYAWGVERKRWLIAHERASVRGDLDRGNAATPFASNPTEDAQ